MLSAIPHIDLVRMPPSLIPHSGPEFSFQGGYRDVSVIGASIQGPGLHLRNGLELGSYGPHKALMIAYSYEDELL